jgi:hypothetical protein
MRWHWFAGRKPLSQHQWSRGTATGGHQGPHHPTASPTGPRSMTARGINDPAWRQPRPHGTEELC